MDMAAWIDGDRLEFIKMGPESSSVHNSSSIEEEGYHYADLQHPQQQSTSGETHLTDDIEDLNE